MASSAAQYGKDPLELEISRDHLTAYLHVRQGAAPTIDDVLKLLENEKIAYGVKNRLWYQQIRPRVNLMERIVRMIGVPRLERFAAKRVRADRHISFSIPGYANLGSCWENNDN